MRVLVTGAAGFLGSYVCQELESAGHEVVALDLRKPASGSVWSHDITQPLSPVPDLDAVIHLAAVSHPRDCDNNPTLAFDNNVNGTHQVLKMAWESGARKVVFASTAHVYGISPKYLPTDERHPLWLQNTYTITKILGEQLCQLYYENHSLSYTVLRLYNACGPGQGAGYFIPDMLARARTGHIDLPGANTTKDFVYAGDVAKAFMSALTTPFVGAINIGSGQEIALGPIAEVIGKRYGATCHTADSPTATRMCAHNRLAKQVLGWAPSRTLWEVLDAVLDPVKV